MSKNQPIMSATELKKDLIGTTSVEKVRRQLREHNLNVYSPSKLPLLPRKHVTKHFDLAKSYLN